MLPNSKHAQYLLLSCNSLSYFQSHPFTLTSAPEEPFISVHVRAVGDWTFSLRTLCERVGHVPNESDYNTSPLKAFSIQGNLSNRRLLMPPDISSSLWLSFLIDGPYGGAFQQAFSFEVILCIGAGIGQTPFASLLKSIWYRNPVTNSSIAGKCIYLL